jgi:drug/metabolite transporter (DMT)-like permease
MSWFTLALGSVFALATAELMQQYLLNKKIAFTERTSFVLTVLFESIFMLPILLFFADKSKFFTIFSTNILPRFAAVALLGSIGYIFYFKSFKVKSISFSSIFETCSAVISTILGIILFDESTAPLKFLGIVLILFAVVLLNIKNASLEKNNFFGLLAGACFGMTYTLDKSIIRSVPPVIYMFWLFLFISLISTLFNPKEVLSSLKNKSFSAYYPVVISAFGYAIYHFFTFTAYTHGGEVGRIDAINNSQVFLIILFEYFILKHTKSTKRKYMKLAKNLKEKRRRQRDERGIDTHSSRTYFASIQARHLAGQSGNICPISGLLDSMEPALDLLTNGFARVFNHVRTLRREGVIS